MYGVRALVHPALLTYSFPDSKQCLGNHKKYAPSAAGQKFLSIAGVASIFPKSTKGHKQHNLDPGLHQDSRLYSTCLLTPTALVVALWLCDTYSDILTHTHTHTEVNLHWRRGRW